MSEITYRVIDIRTNEDITYEHYWVLRADGSLAYWNYGDFADLDYARPVFTMKEIVIND
jgi:hypothetical protein